MKKVCIYCIYSTYLQHLIFCDIGGFHHSDTIKSNLIDHYVPFLPMERRHIKMCIIDEFKQRNVTSPKEEHIR
jgi:hypothetical protein